MEKYKVKVQYVFECTFEIEAGNIVEAKTYGLKHCGAVSPNYQSTITDEWVGDVHPSVKRVKSAKKIYDD